MSAQPPLTRALDHALRHHTRRWHDRLPGGAARRWDRLVRCAATHPPARAAVLDWADGRIARFSDLRLIALMLAEMDDHARHDACLQRFDPELPLSTAPRRFVAHGLGPGSLNRFRRLETPDGPRFEKIYDLRSTCYQRMRFAYDTVLPALDALDADGPPLRAPGLRAVRRGARLAAVEFDFVPTHAHPRRDLGRALEVAHRLGALTPRRLRPLPDKLRTPRKALRWSRARLLALLEAEAPELLALPGGAGGLAAALEAWDAPVRRLPRVFTHGDLNTVNLAPNGVVLDWDRAGFLPWGAELAYAVLFHGDVDSAEALLAFYAEHVERPGHAAQDRFAFLMYLLHFLPERFAPGRDRAVYAGTLQALHAAATRLEAA